MLTPSLPLPDTESCQIICACSLVFRVRPKVRGRLEDAVVDDELPVGRGDGVLGRGQVQYVTVRARYGGPAQWIL